MKILSKTRLFFVSAVILCASCTTLDSAHLKSAQNDSGAKIFASPEENINFYMRSCLNRELNNVKKCFKNGDIVTEIFLIRKEHAASFSYSVKSVTIYDVKSLKSLKKTYKFLFDFRNSPKKDDAGVIVSEKYIGDGEWRNLDFYYLLRKTDNSWLIINNVSLQDID